MVVTQHTLQYLSDFMSPVTYTFKKTGKTNVSCFVLYVWGFHLMIPFEDSQIILSQHSWFLWLQTNCACHEALVQNRSSSIAQGQGVSTPGFSLAAALADEPSWLYDLTCYRGNILSSHQLPVHHCDSMLRNVYLTKSSNKFSWYYRAKYFKKYYRLFPCKPQLCRKIRPTSYKKSLKDIQNAIFCIIILDKYQIPAPGKSSSCKKYIFLVCFPFFFFSNSLWKVEQILHL